MNLAALYHRSLDNWCYPLDNDTLHLRLQTAAGDAETVRMVAGDPFDWKAKQWQSQAQDLRKAGSDGLHDFWETTWKPEWKRTKYYFEVTGGGETWILSERGVHPGTEGRPAPEALYRNGYIFPYINAVDVFRAPDWVHGTVWYQVFPERFENGRPEGKNTLAWHRGPVTNHEFYGGDLAGITSRLDHLSSLGVTGLYMTPVFLSPSVHKYDTADYKTIDPSFGTLDDLKALVAEAHRRGIRVLLDAVFNHSGVQWEPWKDVVAHGQASKYAGWFHIHDWTDLASGKGYETFAFAKSMPKLNTAHPEVKAFLLDVAVYWIREAGIDGWRLDVSNEVDQEFWRSFRQAVKAVNPEAYIVGEIWHDSLRWLRGDQYDAVMNYRYGHAVSDFVLEKNGMASAAEFIQTIDAIDASYTLPILRSAFNVLDSHDTDRFITRCGGDRARARLGWLLLFALRGSPCVYYGSEVGMEGEHDPDNRRCMVWDEEHQDAAHLAWFRSLVALRTAEADLFTYGDRRWLLDPARSAYLGLEVSFGGRRVTIEVQRSAQVAAWGPAPGKVVLGDEGPWGHRISVS